MYGITQGMGDVRDNARYGDVRDNARYGGCMGDAVRSERTGKQSVKSLELVSSGISKKLCARAIPPINVQRL